MEITIQYERYCFLKVFKGRSRAKQSTARRKENYLDAASELIQEAEVSLPLSPVLFRTPFYL